MTMTALAGAFIFLSMVWALLLRPWRLWQRQPALLWSAAGLIVLLPWCWYLPQWSQQALLTNAASLPNSSIVAPIVAPIVVPISGACIALLMLGWPTWILATLIALAHYAWVSSAPLATLMDLWLWRLWLPALIALVGNQLLQRLIAPHLFVYLLLRGCLLSALSLWLAQILAHFAGAPNITVAVPSAFIYYALVAWGEGFVTGLLLAVFFALRPQWLHSYSDEVYLSASTR